MRVSSVVAREAPQDCPVHVAVRVRPQVRASARRRRGEPPVIDFVFDPFMKALDHLERGPNTLDDTLVVLRRTAGRFGSDGPPAHPGLITWTEEALARYVAARQDRHGAVDGRGGDLLPARAEWVACFGAVDGPPDTRGIQRIERTAWGRRYTSPDGRIRELWLPSIGKVREDRPDAEIAAAAAVVAQGAACAPSRWWEPYRELDSQPCTPEVIRIVGFGSLDGQTEILFEGDPDMIRKAFRTHTAAVFARAVTGGDPVPGASCVKCKAIASCDTLPRTPRLWGAADPDVARPRRSVSVWDLRVHAECPARYHLTRQLKLRGDDEEPPAARRGRAVDSWLNERHRKPASGGCRGETLPEDPADWSAENHRLTGQDALDGAAMLLRHRVLCPVGRGESFGDFQVQRQVTAYDEALDVVVIATPDLLYTDGGGWVWRETKTSKSPLWDRAPLMRTYPQLAMATLLLSAGALPGAPQRSRVELELLTPDRCNLETLDPSRSAVVDEARTIIADLAGPLLADSTFAPRTGRHCNGCEVRRWCTEGRDFTNAPNDDTTMNGCR
ncbi:PD-(D/E)XK nuclease family protein [Nocardia cyriacigeorgica]|uniref:PD-(D/E)XK nuclease family protein n=1 Tax=Nocardia cyriacigeorgica TaxID=135487 RepID=UPI001894E1D4|nr:PD-(D/E)XK nuclease family protein [Nocardia cyriacigeorgica]MBF6399460.1 PD-(D/E)XK nuclease family protein [Nocardia cyriacigeorgica]MBF6405090.1 PD-(D/E)XK nuclease family protein [Nocardia cyriacigeorgica]